jgi:ADP-heptose:LPS heptosyltransferase
VVPRQEQPALDANQFDWQCPLGSLGRWLRPSFPSFSASAGYLRPDPARVTRYASRLREPGTRKVIGISWRSINREYGGAKSIPLSDWRTILRSPGLRFVDLQYGDTRAERAALAQESVELLHFDEIDLYRDLEGMAALCAACDLVITASNVTAHFAGAIGKPTWLLAPAGRGRTWHWFSGRSDSPWYPSLRVFTQRTPGRWAEALADVEAALLERRQ